MISVDRAKPLLGAMSRVVSGTGWPCLTRCFFHVETQGGGEMVACQQLLVPRVAVASARALVGLLVEERLQAVRDLKHHLKDMLLLAPSSSSVEGGGGGPGGVVTTRLLQLLHHQQELLVDYYMEARDHLDWCLMNSDEGSARRHGIVVPPRLGGCLHRRSHFKKTAIWQFQPINLNVELLYASQDPSPGPSCCPPVDMMPTVTLGCPAAHACGFGSGGLRSLLLGTGSALLPAADVAGAMRDPMLRLNSYRVMWQLMGEARVLCASLQGPAAEGGAVAVDESAASSALDELPAMRLLRSSSLRADMVCSQCLALALTSLSTFLHLCPASTRHAQILPRVLQAGFLVSVESLLTTAGHEQVSCYALRRRWSPCPGQVART